MLFFLQAVAAAEVMSDRYCVQFGINVNISANDLTACCHLCGNGWEGEIQTVPRCKSYTVLIDAGVGIRSWPSAIGRRRAS